MNTIEKKFSLLDCSEMINTIFKELPNKVYLFLTANNNLKYIYAK